MLLGGTERKESGHCEKKQNWRVEICIYLWA